MARSAKIRIAAATYLRAVEFAQHLHQENIENIARPVLPLWPSACMESLGNLFVDSQASHMRLRLQTELIKSHSFHASSILPTQPLRASIIPG